VSDPFPAVAEAAATGETAELFADIRATVGVRVVNLVWRHLATFDGALPWAWTAVKPLYQRGIADQADLAGDVLVEVIGVERSVDDLLPRRHLHAEIRLRERTADAEDQVGIVEEMPHRLGDRQAARPQRQRMILGEGGLAAEAGRHRRGEQFGQRLQLRPGPRPMHAGAGIDHRPLRRRDRIRRTAHIRRVGAVACRDDGRIDQRLRHLVIPHVGRDLDQHGTAAAVP